ncbi:hypothetical protein QKU48_gp0877 [Fadolivirus algeromassiliense]|jgi:hypothetical protein|uniref:Uncharacterized protein n=1 Tax=Fadolivirus FV1/VV64 TaxID=3070911 RepID=A0A7D3V5Q9_9VIRU|nr:hypothetical protein QKU48_gp0877 [Fadolivirus algeromassiliense]QKF94335.1 hypothetical protein Fadolivirus_1_877 [Fadolivirus FV1/VV64]
MSQIPQSGQNFQGLPVQGSIPEPQIALPVAPLIQPGGPGSYGMTSEMSPIAQSVQSPASPQQIALAQNTLDRLQGKLGAKFDQGVGMAEGKLQGLTGEDVTLPHKPKTWIWIVIVICVCYLVCLCSSIIASFTGMMTK